MSAFEAAGALIERPGARNLNGRKSKPRPFLGDSEERPTALMSALPFPIDSVKSPSAATSTNRA